MVGPLKAKEASLVEINAVLFGVYEPASASAAVEVVSLPVNYVPVTPSYLFQDTRPKPLQSEEISLAKINDILANSVTTYGFINATLS